MMISIPVPPDQYLFPIGFGLAAVVLGTLLCFALGKYSRAKENPTNSVLMSKEETQWTVMSVFTGAACGLLFIGAFIFMCMNFGEVLDKAYPEVSPAEINQVIESEEK